MKTMIELRKRLKQAHRWGKLPGILFLLAGIAPVLAADFALSRPAVEMRRLQFCSQCREPLVVTSIAPGAAVRCPKCATVTRRLPDRELLVKVYQVCPSCSARLDVSNLSADAPLRCGSCGLAQRAMPDAIYLQHSRSGTGEIPPGPTVKGVPPPSFPAGRNLPVPKVPGLNAAAAPEASRPSPTVPAENAAPRKTAPVSRPAAPLSPLPAPENTIKVSVLVNGQPVSTAAVRQTVQRNLELLRLREGRAANGEELARLQQRITEELIEREVLRQAAAQAGYIPDENAVRARWSKAPQSLTLEGVRAEMIREEMKKRHSGTVAKIAEKDVEKYYYDHREDFLRRPRLRLRALTVYKNREGRPDRRPAETIAAEIKEKLDFGIKFAAVASRYSEDVFRSEGGLMRGSAGNDLIAVDDLAEPLYVIFARPRVGEIFGPLQLLTGYAFCLVEKVEPAPAGTLDNSREEIRTLLRQRANEAAFAAWLTGLKKNAVIEYQ